MRPPTQNPSRRQILGAAAALPLTWSASNLLAEESSTSAAPRAVAPPSQSQPNYTFNLEAKSIAPVGQPIEATLVNGSLPGTEIRYHEGDNEYICWGPWMQARGDSIELVMKMIDDYIGRESNADKKHP